MGIKYESILQLLTEADVNAIHQKYYADIPIELLVKTIQSDPTSVIDENGEVKKIGDYVKWLLKFRKQPRYEEDLVKVKGWLTMFDLNKKKVHLQGWPTDITKIKNLKDLYETASRIEFLINTRKALGLSDSVSKRSQKKEDVKNIIENQSKVFKVENWTIAIPLTHASACYWGADTAWCTAVRPKEGQDPEEASETFDHYSDEGPLYVLKNNSNGERFQFHFESQQFMNVLDDEIDIIKFLRENRDVFEFFWNEKPALTKHWMYPLNYIDGKFYVIVDGWAKLINLCIQPGAGFNSLKSAIIGEKKTSIDNSITTHLSSEVYDAILKLINKDSTEKPVDWRNVDEILETSPSMAKVRKAILDVWNQHIEDAKNNAKSFLVKVFNRVNKYNDSEVWAAKWRNLVKEEDGNLTISVCDLAGFQLFIDARHLGFMNIRQSMGIFRYIPPSSITNDEIFFLITNNDIFDRIRNLS